jgi:hypothetical protein
MSLWMLIVLLGLIKLPLIGLMLWMPFRNDEAVLAPDLTDSSSEDDGGSPTLPGGPLDPHPHMPLPRPPRRDPHGSPAIPAPRRVRTPVRAKGVRISR